MSEAARRLRSDAARVVKLLTRAQPLAGLGPSPSGASPVERQEGLAVLAVGLTSAVDYLLNLSIHRLARPLRSPSPTTPGGAWRAAGPTGLAIA